MLGVYNIDPSTYGHTLGPFGASCGAAGLSEVQNPGGGKARLLRGGHLLPCTASCSAAARLMCPASRQIASMCKVAEAD